MAGRIHIMRRETNEPSRADFPADAAAVVCRVRDSLTRVATRIPGFTFRRPNDLATELGLDPKLAWLVGRCILQPDPFAAAQLIPGPTGITTFLRAAGRRGSAAEAIEAARQAAEQFSQLVRTHGGTRKQFNAIATGMASARRVSSEVEHRRRAFEGNSYIWGVYARTIFRSNLILPSANPDMWDLATVRGYVDFCRLRPNVAWRVQRAYSFDTAGTVREKGRREPLEPSTLHADTGLPLLRDFCSHPLPQFHPILGVPGEREYEFVASSVGRTSRITCVTGELLTQVEPRYRSDGYDGFRALFPVRTPAEVLVFDLLIHKGVFEGSQPLQAELLSDLFGSGAIVSYTESDRLPLYEPVRYLGTGPDVASTPDIPQYQEMLRFALARVGFEGDQFDVFRLRMEYPPIPSKLRVGRPLPERPTPIS